MRNSLIAVRKANTGSRVAQVHVSTLGGEEGGQEPAKSELRKCSSAVKFPSKDKAFPSRRSAQPIEKRLMGHAASFGVSLMSCCAMKKQGHFDITKWHRSPRYTTASFPIMILRKHVVYGNAEPTAKIRALPTRGWQLDKLRVQLYNRFFASYYFVYYNEAI